MKIPDLGLLVPALLLTILGLFISSSIAPADFNFQLKIAIFGLILFFLISQLDLEILKLLSLFIFIILIIFLIGILIFADPVRGSKRWLSIFGQNMQVSEFIKPILILLFAHIYQYLNFEKFHSFLLCLGLIFVPFLLTFLQPDLGSALTIGLVGLFCLLTFPFKKRFFIGIFVFLVLILPIFFKSLAPYQQARIENFLSPKSDPLGASYNQIQAQIAAGSGNFWGKGLGKGTQSHLQFLPEKHTDFIFASLAEEFGFVGSLLVLILFAILGLRLLRLSDFTNDKKLKTIFVGSFALVFLQASIHIGINLGILPVTGLTLPFLSIGGSSMIVNWLVLGIATSAKNEIKSQQTWIIS
jgi:rod shape determining protein RodA